MQHPGIDVNACGCSHSSCRRLHKVNNTFILAAGQYCENTVEALKALTEEDNGPEGPIKDLHYVEIDIQV